MEKVTMDFAFPVLEKIYGTFLVTLYEHFEDATLIDARPFFYPNESRKDLIIVSVTVPEDIAMLLKLQFSGNMRTRPVPEPFPELSKSKYIEMENLINKFENKYFEHIIEKKYYSKNTY